jgi:thiosulfate reductase cytochrome b subunit
MSLMPDVLTETASTIRHATHARWVRIAHWLVAASLLTLTVSGVTILMAHPRLYWGEAGNDLTPALLELPISRNYKHGGWERRQPFFADAGAPVSASRTFNIFNQNGWGRSLHFLAAWFLVVPGLVYLVCGIASGHFRAHFVPGRTELARRAIAAELVDHLRLRIRAATGGPQYGLLQKLAYSAVVFGGLPLMGITGLAMSPAVTSAYPLLSSLFGGYQSARTIHFFTFAALALFVIMHLVMVMKSGFRRQIRAMTVGGLKP